MVEYRAFRNNDPPQIAKLWHASQLGRGAALGIPNDAFDLVNYAQPYFDPRGLIVAHEGAEVVGLVHAGFGPNRDGSGLCRETGVICAVLVEPRFRRRGIGRELVRRAESYLREAGATMIYAGPASPRDPFYFGIYGGTQPAGFLESDPDAAPFFQALGYETAERHCVYQRDIQHQRDPVSARLQEIRRTTDLALADLPNAANWWWMTRLGRLETVQWLLVPKSGGPRLAEVTMLGLDLFFPHWLKYSVGLTGLFVPESQRRKGYGKALLIEVARRMRQESVVCIDMQAAECDTAGRATLESVGFQQVETGAVYRRVDTPGRIL